MAALFLNTPHGVHCRLPGLLSSPHVDLNGDRFNPGAPFGVDKKSGIGRELGAFGLDEFLEIKVVQR